VRALEWSISEGGDVLIAKALFLRQLISEPAGEAGAGSPVPPGLQAEKMLRRSSAWRGAAKKAVENPQAALVLA
jgi:hypothetical protein